MSSIARIVSLSVLTTLIVMLGITFYQVVAPFLLPLFLAGIFTILFQPLFKYFVRRTNGRVRVAAGITTAIVMLLILVPLLLGTLVAALQLYGFATESVASQDWAEPLREMQQAWKTDQLYERLRPVLPPDMTLEDFARQRETFEERLLENVRESIRMLASRTLGLAGATLDLLGSLVAVLIAFVMFGIALYYFLADGPALLAAAEGLIPVHADYQRQLIQRFDKVVRAVVMATLVSAIAQGLATATLLYVAGIHHFFIFFVVTTCTAVIPLAGTWVVWGPCAVWLLLQGHWAVALFVIAVGAIVIGTMDNLIKTYVLQSDAKLHPLLAFVSVLGGLRAMGLWGVFIGPVAASCLHALVQIFNVELQALSEERRSKAVRHRLKPAQDRPPARRTAATEDGSQALAEPEPASAPSAAVADSQAARPPKSRRRRSRRRRHRSGKPRQQRQSET
jgi:predicted PurR-regulated permease PerM